MQGMWQPSLNISTVLTSIGLLLSEPNPDDGLMHEAVSEASPQEKLCIHRYIIMIFVQYCAEQRLQI